MLYCHNRADLKQLFGISQVISAFVGASMLIPRCTREPEVAIHQVKFKETNNKKYQTLNRELSTAYPVSLSYYILVNSHQYEHYRVDVSICPEYSVICFA